MIQTMSKTKMNTTSAQEPPTCSASERRICPVTTEPREITFEPKIVHAALKDSRRRNTKRVRSLLP